MYLGELKEAQKNLFLDLCINLAMSDERFAHEEKTMLKQMCHEMGIDERYSTEKSVADAINELAESATDREKRIMIIELAGIIMADNVYHESEKKILKDLSEAFEISFDETEKIIPTISRLYNVYSNFAKFLTGKPI